MKEFFLLPKSLIMRNLIQHSSYKGYLYFHMDLYTDFHAGNSTIDISYNKFGMFSPDRYNRN